MKIVFISGSISSDLKHYKAKFAIAEFRLKAKGYIVINPAYLPLGLLHEQYMSICYVMLDVCDTVYFLKGWEQSKGAKMEMGYALAKKLNIRFEEVTE